jgi:predicted Zn-dependent protease
MKFKIILLATFFCCLSVFANELPDLGDSSQLIISAKEEQAIAKAILKEVAVSPEIVQDIEVIDYLKNLSLNSTKNNFLQ